MEDVPSIADFRSPPVVEVVCGVQFDPLPGFSTVHLGLYWESVRQAFPQARDLPPVPLVVENRAGLGHQSITLGVWGAQTPRVQFVDETGGQVLQLQSGRFSHNWQRRHSGDEYRRYARIAPAFLGRWAEFRAFLARSGFASPHPNQYDLSYVNQIPAGELWDDQRGIREVLPWFAPPSTIVDGVEPELALHSSVPQCQGRLHVTGKVGLRVLDRTRVFQLELTVRGAPSNREGTDLPAWLNVAHEIIVRRFVELTSERARRHWGQIK